MTADKDLTISNEAGLTFGFLPNGAVKSIEAGPIRINLKPATMDSVPGTNIFLRKRGKKIQYRALLGPDSPGRFNAMGNWFLAAGNWDGLDYSCHLQLSEKSLSWQWTVEITNRTGSREELDLVWIQDVGLKTRSDALVNEYYISQYLERRILEDKEHGTVVCCRQNMKEASGNPWLMTACSNRGVIASVDGIQFYGIMYRLAGIPDGLTGDDGMGEYAGETSLLTIREAPFDLPPGKKHKSAFATLYMPDHPGATTESDLALLPGLFSEFYRAGMYPDPEVLHVPSISLGSVVGFLPVDDLDEGELDRFFGTERLHPEFLENKPVSFFTGEGDHVVLRFKEYLTERPHGHIMQAKTGFAPDESIVSTTAWAAGIFNSHLSQGNTNFNVLLSINNDPFNNDRSTGQRIYVMTDRGIKLLGIPSAFEMGLNHCRWIYKSGALCLQVRTWTSMTLPRVNLDVRVLSGDPVSITVLHDPDPLNGWSVARDHHRNELALFPKPGSMLAGHFPKARFRVIVNSPSTDYEAIFGDIVDEDGNIGSDPGFSLDVNKTTEFCMSFIGEVGSQVTAGKIKDADRQFDEDRRDAKANWVNLSLGLSLESDSEDIAVLREILPWYGMNALVHFLTPYGLEQFSGAAWGTRDVSQGPVDLLLATEKYSEARRVICMIFSNQNPDGGWPQWWMFDSYHTIRADSAHGDVVYWCIIALCKYIRVTGDFGILAEVLPWYHEKGPEYAQRSPLSEHVDRLIRMIVDSFLPGIALVPFGGGDWNDSLQPVSKEVAARMISSWTVEMNYQAFDQYRRIHESCGNLEKARELSAICERISSDFNRHLVRDGVVAGYGMVGEDGTISLMLHPSDKKTGVRYSLLPMNRGIISGIFTPEQAEKHLGIVERHLKGPDGARLMDRPLRYKGGIQEIFQRAESSTYFGREIGLMYMHEHIRYAESLAIMGRADDFLRALRQASPVFYQDTVPLGDLRQSNCYYTSSDVVFRNRYEADREYEDIINGYILLKGGWRVYSSGPGIYLALVYTRLLGLRIEDDHVILDPVIPKSLDGLSASLTWLGCRIKLNYSVEMRSFAPSLVTVNGKRVEFTREENKYRAGGAVIPASLFISMNGREENIVEIHL